MEQALRSVQGFVMMNENDLHIFGVRHLSPAGAWHLQGYLDRYDPRLVLIEGPEDFNPSILELVKKEVEPPVAILAYTVEVPVRSILYPLAEYSPEYQAVKWCSTHHRECRFMDLPASVLLGIPENGGKSEESEYEGETVYSQLDERAGEDGHEMFWERVMEHTEDLQGYHEGVNLFGSQIRQFEEEHGDSPVRDLVREAFMRRQIEAALREGYKKSEIVIVTGAYHVEGLKGNLPGMSDEELALLPRVSIHHTLMPYSYYRMSTRGGYGAGNKAPAYYEMLWESFLSGNQKETTLKYLTGIAVWQRAHGNPVSSAEVIEGVRLANALAQMRGSRVPVLRDLRDAAVTCLGGGKLSTINLAVADTEIGTKIGALPEGVSRTSIQDDFYRKLKELHLESYRDITAKDLALDLRENRKARSEASAFLDLHRSFFLHRLRVLGIHFAVEQQTKQDNATWSEKWVLRWTPEAEIELVESALLGDTVLAAASIFLKERLENQASMGEIAAVLNDAFLCGMVEAVEYATKALQAAAVENAALAELADTARTLSYILQYGTIRKLDSKPVLPILEQIFLRACLLLPAASVCDAAACAVVIEAMEKLNRVELAHDFIDSSVWVDVLSGIAERDDCNTKISGYCMAVLLERGVIDNGKLHIEVSRRLSNGVPADLGAAWFEGLAMKNRYALIGRLSLWESLDNYLDTLEPMEFKRALLFLRRAFADFSSAEKDQIAENLGEIWGLNKQNVSEVLNAALDNNEQELVTSLDDFNFDF